MTENSKTRKKEIIKTIAIIFLAVMLVLTFFSNTIMNYSLPQVATQYVESGSISSLIRGTGTVTATDPYSVEIKETRTISSVAVKKGDVVEKGEELFFLADTDSTELAEAKETLENLQAAFDQALLSTDVTSEIYNHAVSGKTTSTSDYRKTLQAKMDAVTKAQETVDAKQDKLDAL